MCNAWDFQIAIQSVTAVCQIDSVSADNGVLGKNSVSETVHALRHVLIVANCHSDLLHL